MSHKQKLEELKLQLERWKSHNEVHSRPGDDILYNVIDGILNLAENDEQPDVIETANAETDPPGGNNPSVPDIP